MLFGGLVVPGARRPSGIWTPYGPFEDEGETPSYAPSWWPLPLINNAGNVALNDSSDRMLLRIVHEVTGTMTELHLNLITEGADDDPGSRSGYGDGDTGEAEITFWTIHPLTGEPEFQIGSTIEKVPGVGGAFGEFKISGLSIPAVKGEELGIVARNIHSNPNSNYWSFNHGYRIDAVHEGALSQNLRTWDTDPLIIAQAGMGFDPRTALGWSFDGGSSWNIPGGPYGARRWTPSYGVRYSGDSTYYGQFYYGATDPGSGTKTVRFQDLPAAGTVTHVAIQRGDSGSGGDITVHVNGGDVAGTATFSSGDEGPAIAEVDAEVDYDAGDYLQLKGNAATLGLPRLYAYQHFQGKTLGDDYRWYDEGFDTRMVPMMPIPNPYNEAA